MKVLFAPDYRNALQYQAFLARELAGYGIHVDFLSDYRRGMPLTRGIQNTECDILHLHWPEAYFSKRDSLGWLRKIRYHLDLRGANRGRKLFLTAHNLLPHNRHRELGVSAAIKATAKRANGVFVHSEFAAEEFSRTFGVSTKKCHVVPYGDHTDGWLPPIDSAVARAELQLSENAKICLVFGTVSPYKGTDEIVEFWRRNRPEATLVIVGPVLDESFEGRLISVAKDDKNIDLRMSRDWLSDKDLWCWLSAVDCTIFNYKEIFTSGAAAMARSMGVPVLIPQRLQAADLHEPHPLVHRFDSLKTDFTTHLHAALMQTRDYAAASKWRSETSWQEVARLTRNAYFGE